VNALTKTQRNPQVNQMGFQKFLYRLKEEKVLHLMMLPAVLATIIMAYFPMYGLIIAFKKYDVFKGVFKSSWASSYGFEHFIDFLNSPSFGHVLTNTILIALLKLVLLSFIITALWWLVFSIPMLKNVKQINYIEREPHMIIKSFKRILNTFKNIKQHKHIFLFLFAYFFYIDGVNTIIHMASVYGDSVGLSSSTLLLALLVTQIVAFPCAIIYGKLAEKFGSNIMILAGIVIYIIICIVAFRMTTAIEFWILAILVATSQGGIQALSRSTFGKIIPKENSNEFFGFYDIFGKFAAIMGPALYGFFSQITGQSRFGVLSIMLLFLIGGFVFVIVTWFGPDKHKQVNS